VKLEIAILYKNLYYTFHMEHIVYALAFILYHYQNRKPPHYISTYGISSRHHGLSRRYVVWSSHDVVVDEDLLIVLSIFSSAVMFVMMFLRHTRRRRIVIIGVTSATTFCPIRVTCCFLIVSVTIK